MTTEKATTTPQNDRFNVHMCFKLIGTFFFLLSPLKNNNEKCPNSRLCGEHEYTIVNFSSCCSTEIPCLGSWVACHFFYKLNELKKFQSSTNKMKLYFQVFLST